MIEGMEFYAKHGCYAEEKLTGNKFLVDLTVYGNVQAAIDSDDIQKAINYQKLYEIVKEQMMQTSHLLEHVCNRILDKLNDFGNIDKATIKLSKLNPNMGGKIEKVSMVLSREYPQ